MAFEPSITIFDACVLYPFHLRNITTSGAQPPAGIEDAYRREIAGPVPSDCGLSLVPTSTFENYPQLDPICVPGGSGVAGAMSDPETIAFVRRQAEGSQYITSVCTGAFVLGAAGLLRGRRVTTHWAYTRTFCL